MAAYDSPTPSTTLSFQLNGMRSLTSEGASGLFGFVGHVYLLKGWPS